MRHWLVELVGEDFDLDLLTKLFVGPTVAVVRLESRYFLQVPAWDTLTDEEAVFQRALAMLPAIHGAASVVLHTYEPVRVRAVQCLHDTGAVTNNVRVLLPSIRSRGMVGTVEAHIDGRPSATTPLNASDWIQLAFEDRDVADALILVLGSPGRWHQLYKAFEAIFRATGQQPSKMEEWGLATARDVTNFQGSANDGARDIFEARHALLEVKVPYDPMTLAEAELWVRNVVAKFIRFRLIQRSARQDRAQPGS